MKSTKAYILSNGEVVSGDALQKRSIKTQSKKLPVDLFTESYGVLGIIEPLYNLESLIMLLEQNTWHYRACKTKARDTAGLGWKIVAKEGIRSPGQKAQKRALEEFLINNGTSPQSPVEDLTEILNRFMVDYESTGNGYLEYIRDSVDLAPIGINHIPSHTMRRHSDGLRYIQMRGAQVRWFKAIGEERDIDMNTGEFFPKGKLDINKRGNEVIHLYNYTSRSDYYGIPDVLPALRSLILDYEALEYNIDFFENNAMPAYAVTITGADMDAEMEGAIREYFQRDVKNSRQSTLVITAQGSPNNVSSKPIEIKFEKLNADIQDASFQILRQNNREEILSAHGVPPYRAGVSVVGNLGGSTAEESTEIYKQSVITPRQASIENIFNIYLLPAFGVYDYVFKFNSIDTEDEQKKIKNAIELLKIGIITPNQARQMLGYEADSFPLMDEYYFEGVRMTFNFKQENENPNINPNINY